MMCIHKRSRPCAGSQSACGYHFSSNAPTKPNRWQRIPQTDPTPLSDHRADKPTAAHGSQRDRCLRSTHGGKRNPEPTL
eukprot:8050288-Pyramimonas_sp.AAC.1